MFRPLPLLLAALLCTGCGGYGTKTTFNGGELYRTSSVTKDETDRLGQYLIRDGFFDGTKKTVQLNKKDGAYEVRLVIKPEFRDDDDYRRLLELFAAQVRDNVFPGETVVVHLCDDRLNKVHEVPAPESHTANKGTVYYNPPVTKEEVEKLTQLLVAEKFFDGSPKTVRLTRSGDGYEFAIPIVPGTLMNPVMMKAFKETQKELSQKAFGGKPVTLMLCDDHMKKLKVMNPE